MAYDDPRYRRHEEVTESMRPGQPAYHGGGWPGERAGVGYRGEPAGYRGEPVDYPDEPDPRIATAAYETGYDPGPGGYRDPEPAEPVSPAELRTVFDERGGADPGADRLAVHLLWEFVLVLGVAGLVFLLLQAQPDALRGAELSQLLVYGTGFGLLGLAAGVTLRAGVPNLAVGPVAAAAGAYVAEHGGDGVVVPTIFTVGVAIVLGLLLAGVVAGLHVPGWAASLAAAGAVVVWLQLRPAEIPLAGAFDPAGQAAFLFAVVAAMGILGGLLGTLKPVRRAVGGLRPAGDVAQRRGGQPAALAGGAIVLSMVFSAVAGVVLVTGEGTPAQGSTGVNWLTWTLIGLGVALVGGTSAYGRRGGVFGTVLAVVALVLFHRYQQEQEWEIALLATAVATVLIGLAVTRLVERFGRDWSAAGEPQAWTTTPPAEGEGRAGRRSVAAEGRPSAATDSWSSALTARPAPSQPAPWEEERWGR